MHMPSSAISVGSAGYLIQVVPLPEPVIIILLVAAMTAFHRDAPPAARLPWLLALPVGYLLVFGPLLALVALLLLVAMPFRHSLIPAFIGIVIIYWLHSQHHLDIVVEPSPPPPDAPMISVCIPARNEERNHSRLNAASSDGQHQLLEFSTLTCLSGSNRNPILKTFESRKR